MKYFFQEQAEYLPKNSRLKQQGKTMVIEQDNTSAIQLQMNGQ